MDAHNISEWTYEVHELSEGFSAIVYDEGGRMVADHLTEERARLISAAPNLLKALQMVIARCGPLSEDGRIARAAIAKAKGDRQ